MASHGGSLLGHHRGIFLPDVIFEHTNVEISKEGHAIYVPDPDIQQRDTLLFNSLLEERKRIAIEVMQRIEDRLHSEARPTWEKTLGSASPVTR